MDDEVDFVCNTHNISVHLRPRKRVRSDTARAPPTRLPWKPFWCPASPFLLGLAAIQHFDNTNVAPAPPLGHSPAPPPFHLSLHQAVTIKIAELNPDVDIKTIEPVLCTVDVADGADIVSAFDSSGSYVGSLSTALYETLYVRFAHSAAVHTPLSPGPFTLEVIRLLRRYRPQKSSASRALREHATTAVGSGQGVIADLEGPAPPREAPLLVSEDLYSALVATFSLTSEPFSSPLSARSSTLDFASPYPRDALFGSKGPTYNTERWAGACLIHPPAHDVACLREAVRAAKACAASDPSSPFLAVCVLPHLPHADCYRLYTAPGLAIGCHVLATVNKGYFHYSTPEYSFLSPPSARTEPSPLPLPPGPLNNPRHSGSTRPGFDPWSDPARDPAATTAVDIVLIYNHCGLVQFVNRDRLPALEAAILAHATRTHLASAAFRRTKHGQVAAPWASPMFSDPYSARRSDVTAVLTSRWQPTTTSTLFVRLATVTFSDLSSKPKVKKVREEPEAQGGSPPRLAHTTTTHPQPPPAAPQRR